MITTLLFYALFGTAVFMIAHRLGNDSGYRRGRASAHAEHIADIGRARADATMAAHRAEKSRELQNGSVPMDPTDISEALHRTRL